MSASHGKDKHPERGKAYRRILDKFIGVPIVFLLGLFRRKRQKPQDIRSVALLINVAIGDTVIALGVIRDIQRELPFANVTIFVGSSNYEVAKLIDGVTVVKIPVLNIFKTIAILKNYQFDVWLDFGQWARLNAICSFFANAKFKIGFKTNGQYRHYIYDVSISHTSERHEIDNFRALSHAIGINGVALPNLQEQNVQKQNFAVFHPFAGGSRSYLKEWSSDYWRELLVKTSKHYDAIYLSGAGVDEAKINYLIDGLSNVHSLAGKTSIKELVELLNKASLVVSVDTGVMHLASATNTNLVAIHGSTSPKRWGALNQNSISLTPQNLDCAPCLSLGFESKCKNPICMQSITPTMVLDAIDCLQKR